MKRLFVTLSLLLSTSAFALSGEALKNAVLEKGVCVAEGKKGGDKYSHMAFLFFGNGDVEVQLLKGAPSALASSYSDAYGSAYGSSYGSAYGSSYSGPYSSEYQAAIDVDIYLTLDKKWKVLGNQVQVQLSSGWYELDINFDNPAGTIANCQHTKL